MNRAIQSPDWLTLRYPYLESIFMNASMATSLPTSPTISTDANQPTTSPDNGSSADGSSLSTAHYFQLVTLFVSISFFITLFFCCRYISMKRYYRESSLVVSPANSSSRTMEMLDVRHFEELTPLPLYSKDLPSEHTRVTLYPSPNYHESILSNVEEMPSSYLAESVHSDRDTNNATQASSLRDSTTISSGMHENEVHTGSSNTAPSHRNQSPLILARSSSTSSPRPTYYATPDIILGDTNSPPPNRDLPSTSPLQRAADESATL